MARFVAFTLVALAASVSATSPFTTRPKQSKNTRKAKMMSEIMQAARPTDSSQLEKRGLEQNSVDLSGYEMKFQKCQFVKSYDDELAQDNGSDEVLSIRRFVTFRLCPVNTCNKCDDMYGEYVIDLESYISATSEYLVDSRDQYCAACDGICGGDDALKNSGVIDCSTCDSYCADVDSIYENGSIETYTLTGCSQIANNGNEEIYAGVMCGNNGKSISIGAFSDDMCSDAKQVSIEKYLENGVKLSSSILDQLSSSKSCISCTEKTYDGNAENGGNEMCENLYDMSAKCESPYGFDNYWKFYASYENQYLQEDIVCDFIATLNNGNYDQHGEILLSGSKRNGAKGATLTQKFALSVFFFGSIGLCFYSAQIHSQLKRSSRADLSAQGGAMA